MGAMTLGSRHRETGQLTTSARGLILELDDGGIFALDAEPNATELVGHRVILEGTRSGFDRLSVEWIGPAEASPDLIPPSV
jgi:hypothetical protein